MTDRRRFIAKASGMVATVAAATIVDAPNVETTVCKFRHLLEEHRVGPVLFDTVAAYLRDRGIAVSTGTIVDATIISAPASTKNATGSRDPDAVLNNCRRALP
jgi:hypothetical protein